MNNNGVQQQEEEPKTDLEHEVESMMKIAAVGGVLGGFLALLLLGFIQLGSEEENNK